MKGSQSLNLPLSDTASYFNSQLAAGLVGATATGVLRWNAAGTIAGAGISEIGTLANDGTVVALTLPGVYAVNVTIGLQAVASSTFAIAFGPTATTDVAQPHYVTSQGIIRVGSWAIGSAGDFVTATLDAIVVVTLATAKATASVNAVNTLRVRGVVQGGGGPPTGVDVLDSAFIITKSGECWR